MTLIEKNSKIYLQFLSNSKICSRSLNLSYNEKNLRYATKTLLPIFKKILINQKAPYKAKKEKLPYIKNNFKLSSKLSKNPKKLSQYCMIVLYSLKLEAKINTIKNANYLIKRFFDFLEDKNIKAYKALDIQNAIYRMQEANLSPFTIRALLIYPSMAFKIALKNEEIKINPISISKKPKIKYKEKNIFTKEEVKLILKNAKDELRIFLYIAFYTGARSGEILALCLKDINFEQNIININKNQTRFGLNTPKNDKYRTIYLAEPLKKFILSLNLENGIILKNDYFYFYYEFKKLLKTLNLLPRGLHSTRHFYASYLISKKISLTCIANALGHKDISTLTRTYAHQIKNDLENLEFDF